MIYSKENYKLQPLYFPLHETFFNFTRENRQRGHTAQVTEVFGENLSIFHIETLLEDILQSEFVNFSHRNTVRGHFTV